MFRPQIMRQTFGRRAATPLDRGSPALGFASRVVAVGRRPFSQGPVKQNNNTLSILVQGEGTGVAQTVGVKGHPHYKIQTDTYTALGGRDAAPSPLAYSLASLGTCTQVTGSIVAKDLGIGLGKWQVSVQGDLPLGVLVQGEQEGDGNWETVNLQVRVQTDQTDDEKFKRFVAETERRCPITQLFRRSGAGLTSEWVNEPLGSDGKGPTRLP